MTARLRLNAFSMNCVSHITHGLWTRPDTQQLQYAKLDTWVQLAQLLERGRFDALFLADVIGADAGVDGINLTYTTTPGSFEQFIEHVVPVLQDRGLVQREYRPGTLREKLSDGESGPRLPVRHPAGRRRTFGAPVGVV